MRHLLTTMLLALLLATGVPVFAAPPATVTYQGYLATAAGAPLTTPVPMTVSLYVEPTGGSPLWSEHHPDVPVTNGIYTVLMGSITPINLSFDRVYYLGVAVASDPEMTPRQELSAVPYSFRAHSADRLNQACADGEVLTYSAALSGWSCATLPNIGGLAGVATSGSASDLSAGTLPDGRFPAALPAVSGANLTGLTKAQVGLGNVDNTSDANKLVSIATQTALGAKANSSDVTAALAGKVATSTTVNGHALTGNVTVSKTDIGLGNVANLKVNLAAATAPTATDDGSAGYAVGSRWFDTAAKKEYVCTDATTAAAVWKETTNAAAGTPLMAASNLSDLANAAIARTNLGLGSAATMSAASTATANTVATRDVSGDIYATVFRGNLAGLAQGLVSTLPVSNGGTGATNAAAARTNLGLATVAGSGSYTDLINKPAQGLVWNVVTDTTQAAVSNTGYITTSPTLTTVTLPAAPAVGDVVKVSAAGEGGWQVNANTGQSFSVPFVPGVTWTATGPNNMTWKSVASSADGSRLVAVVSGGQIYTSTDTGATWTPRESNRSWSSVASSSDGSKLVAVVTGGQIYISTDAGSTWTPSESNRQWFSVASSSDGSNLVAVASGNFIYTSSDSGVTWTPRATDSTRPWMSVASSSDGTRLIAAVYSGQIYTSNDSGVTWAPRESNRQWWSVASSSDGTKLVAAVSDWTKAGKIYTSSDSGATWAVRVPSGDWKSVASSSSGTRLVAVSALGLIYVSGDSGVTWTSRDSSRNWSAVASSSDGSKLVAGSVGNLYTSVTDVTIQNVAPYTSIEMVYIGNNQWAITQKTTLTL